MAWQANQTTMTYTPTLLKAKLVKVYSDCECSVTNLEALSYSGIMGQARVSLMGPFQPKLFDAYVLWREGTRSSVYLPSELDRLGDI
jgi:hypothetical protein